MELIQKTLQNKTVYAVKFIDGARAAEVEPATLSWSTRLNKAGEVSLDAKVSAHDAEYAVIKAVTEPKLYGLVLEIGDQLVEGGQIVSRDNPDGKITGLIAKGFLEYLQGVHVHSVNFNPFVTDPKDDTATFSDMTLRGIAGAMIMAVVNNPNNAGEVPPVVCDFAGEAGTHSRTYSGADFTTVADAITDLIEAGGGADLAFRPEWVDSSKQAVQWRLVGGEPLLMQVGDPKVIDATAPASGVSKLGVDEDGSTILTRAYAVGSGEGAATVVGVNTALVNKGYPLMEAVAEYDATTQAALNAELDQKLLDSSSTMSTWSLAMAFSDLNEHKPGDFLNIATAGYRTIDDGTRLVRVVGIDGGGKQAVNVHLQPMLTTWANFDPSKVQRRYHEPDPVKAEAEDDKKTKRDIRKAAKTGGSGTGEGGSAVYKTEVTGFSEYEDDMGFWVRNPTGVGPDPLWAINFRNFSAVIGDVVYITKATDNGNQDYIVIGKYYEHVGGLQGVAIVDTANNDTLDATVTIEGAVVEADNYAGRLLASGDQVAYITGADGTKLIVGKGLSSDGTPGQWEPARVSLGYPFPNGSVGMANTAQSSESAQAFIDIDDAAGYGSDAKIIDLPLNNNVYPSPATGTFYTTGKPGADWAWQNRSLFVKEGKLFQWFTNSSGFPYLFKWDRVAHTWSQVPGLPETRNILGEGYWSLGSVQGDVVNFPLVAMVTADAKPYQKVQAGNTIWVYKVYVELWQVTPDGTGWVKSPKLSYETQYKGFGTPSDLTSSSVIYAHGLFNRGHVYMHLSEPAVVNSTGHWKYINTSTGLSFASMTHLGTPTGGDSSWFRWITPDKLIAGTIHYRIRDDGAMFFASSEVTPPNSNQARNTDNLFFLKKPTGEVTEGLWMRNSSDVAGRMVYAASAVHMSGDRFLIVAQVKSLKGTGQPVQMAFEYVLGSNLPREVISDGTPDGASSYSGASKVSRPVKLLNGDLAVLVANSSANPWQASEKIYKFIV